MNETLPKEAITEFQAIYKKVYKTEITFEQAEILALKLYKVMKAIYKPIKKEWLVKLKIG